MVPSADSPVRPAAFTSPNSASPAFCLAASALALDPGFLMDRSCLGTLALRVGSSGRADGRLDAAR
jgi:hypothetical protein